MLNEKKAVLTERKQVSDKVTYYKFKMQDPATVDFKAGQYINIKVSENARRSYSIASEPSLKVELELYVDTLPGGPGSIFFEKIKIGEIIEFLGPIGMFVFDESNTNVKSYLFIATGTGIAPFLSMIKEQLKLGNNKPMHIIFGLRFIKDVYLKEELDKHNKKHSNLTYEIILSKPEDKTWSGKVGHVQDLINEVEDFDNLAGYICGNQKMISDVQELLKTKGVNADNIHFEKFY